MQWKILLITVVILLAGCVTPTTRTIKVDEVADQAEAKLQSEIAFEGLVNDELRLMKVASDIKLLAKGLCGDHVKYGLGVYALNQDMIPKQFKDAAKAHSHVEQKPRVLLVYPGSGSDEAGIKSGDEIISINNWLIPTGESSPKVIREKSETLLKEGKPLEFKIARGSEEINLTVQPKKECAFPVILDESDALNAFADGTNVFITRGMMRFAQDDTELALVVSHEMSHNSMNHIKAQTSNYMLGTILDILIAATTGANTQGTFGKLAAARYSKEFEAEADYVGLYMMAEAGKDFENAPKFWRRMAAAHPGSIKDGYSSSHPSTTYRLLALEETVKEIKHKKEAGLPLTPELKKPVAPSTNSESNSVISPNLTTSNLAVATPLAVEGVYIEKALKTTGLGGIVKGIEVKFSFTNISKKDIAKLVGKAKLYDNVGNEIGSISFRSDNKIPSGNNIEHSQTVYPILFSGYTKLKELEDSNIRADFIYETIEFADGTKVAN